MLKCDAVVMRRNLIIVNELKIHGMDFVSIPVKNAKHKKELKAMAYQILTELLEEAT